MPGTVSPKGRALKAEYDAARATNNLEDNGDADYEHLALNAEEVGSIYKGKDLILKHYKIGKKLGQGAFAVVRHATSRQNKKSFAAKFISKVSSIFRIDAMQREICILKKMDHPHIMRLYAVYDEPKQTTLLLELVLGSNLMDRILKTNMLFSEKKAERLATDIMGALRYLHSMNIAHRDLKPENLMYGSDDPSSSQYDRIKVCDLGLAREYDNSEMLQSACGTPGYMAPELLQRRPYRSKVDIWAIGVTLYQLLCGFLPFPYIQDDETTLQNMEQKTLQFPEEFWADFTADCKDIISKMLDPDENTRLNASDCLEHPWIKYQGETSAAGVHGNHKAFLMLRRLPLFSNVEPSCLGDVTNRLKRKVFEPGDTIINEGEVGESMFFIESGNVNIMIEGKPVDHLRGGMFFGEVALIVKNRRTATAMVPERKVADKYPELKQQLINYATVRLNRYLHSGPLHEAADSNVAKQAVIEVLKAIGSEVSEEGKLMSSRILKRNGMQEDWRAVWRTVGYVIIAVNRILRITKRMQLRSEPAGAGAGGGAGGGAGAGSVEGRRVPRAEEISETRSMLAAGGYLNGEDAVWRQKGEAQPPEAASVPRLWADSPITTSPSLHGTGTNSLCGAIAEDGLFDSDVVMEEADFNRSHSPPRRLSHSAMNSPTRQVAEVAHTGSTSAMSYVGFDSGLASSVTFAASKKSLSGSPRRSLKSNASGGANSFRSFRSAASGASDEDESGDDFEFEQFVVEMQRQHGTTRGHSDRRTSTLPYIEPGRLSTVLGDRIGPGSPAPGDMRNICAGEEEDPGPRRQASARGMLTAGSRTPLPSKPVIEKMSSDSEMEPAPRTEILKVEAPPRPSFACSGVCAVQ